MSPTRPNPEATGSVPGRSCPLRYRHGANALAAAPEQTSDTLYVVGGLYGNLPALHALQQLVAREAAAPTLCFNGDFNWFNVDDAGFAAINRAVLAHDACLGNVEAELLVADDDAGCGCAYPENVDAGIVERSNRIHARLKQTALAHPELLRQLGELPSLRRYRVGDLAIGVVHGDAESLAGWGFDVEALDAPASLPWLDRVFRDARVEVFASSHTCLPALRAIDGAGIVINNGAAGMPNFAGRRCGVVTRIAVSPAPTPALYGCRLGSLHIEALALDYDHAAWEQAFLANWPPGSPAHVSYFRRIVDGPDHLPTRAAAPTR
ncbi:MAG: hypothetical protein HZB40_04605 [Rhodocyclales bacterium]|nr:hypothetical protein [Rhodocyclales bacterium]